MIRFSCPATCVSVGLLILTLSCGGPSNGTRVEVEDVDGVTHHPLDAEDRRATVFFFVAPECPISNGYSPEINRIVSEYGQRGVRFYMVHADRDVTAEQARRHAADYGYACPVLLDRAH